MIKKWEIKEAPSKRISNRKILFVQCDELNDVKILKKNFPGNFGVVFKSPDKNWQYAVFLYNSTPNILKLIEEEIKTPASPQVAKKETKPQPEISEPKKEAPQKPEREVQEIAEPKSETKEEPKKEVKEEKTEKEASPKEEAKEKAKEEIKPEAKTEEKKEAPKEEAKKPEAKVEDKKDEKAKPETKIEKFEKVEVSKEEAPKTSPIIETFEKLTPDSEEAQPLKKPLIERFEGEKEGHGKEVKEEKPAEKEEAKKETQPATPKKGAKKISLLYLTPAQKKDLPKTVHQHIETIVSEKNINFVFENSGLITYEPSEADAEIVKKLSDKSFNFVILVAPDEKGDGIAKELKKQQRPFKVITEDNIDKKFRYLNLITDIVLSPNK